MDNKCRCGSLEYKTIIAKKDKDPQKSFAIIKCKQCDLARTFPFPGEQEAEGDYFLGEEDYKYRLDNLKIWHNFSQELITLAKKFKTNCSWLDVGTNIGVLVADGLKAGYDAYGTDVAEKSIAAGKKLFNLDDRLFATTLPEASFPDKFDLISYNHVLEHIKNLDQELQAANFNLKKGGILLIFVPNFYSIWRLVLRAGWRGLAPESHYWQFEKETLKRILEQNNFKVIKTITNKNVFYKTDFSLAGAAKIMLIIISKLLNLGDNLIIVAEK